MLVQVWCWVGLAPYTARTKFILTCAWTGGWTSTVLLILKIIKDVPAFAYAAASLLVSAGLMMDDGIAMRGADIDKLVAMQGEAAVLVQRLPAGLANLRNAVASFVASIAAAEAQARQAKGAVRRGRLLLDWVLAPRL